MTVMTPTIADQSGWSLPAWTYFDAQFMAIEKAKLFMPAWHLVCHVSDIPRAGDYRTFAMMGERALVVRGKDGAVRAFHNVCPHRAARLVDGDQYGDGGGNCGGRVTCPYHAWSFNLEGQLLAVPFIEEYENFEKGQFGLFPLEHAISHGFVYVRFGEGGEALEDYLSPIMAEMGIYRFADMQPIGPIRSRVREVNWKNASDNYVDALHVRVAHPGLSALVRDSYRLSVDRGVDKIYAEAGMGKSAMRSVQAYRDVLPDVDHLPDDRKRMWTYYRLFPGLMFDVYPDQIDFMQFIPLTPTTCLLRDGAYALPDGRREMKAARYLNQRLNRDVNAEDKALIERVQEGMASSAFSQGPLGKNEICLRSFAERMRQIIPIAAQAQHPGCEALDAALQAALDEAR
jgi:phenylpropionate dioxygenase-like ring-hydroxylating dioxygenase large terminal subunit